MARYRMMAAAVAALLVLPLGTAVAGAQEAAPEVPQEEIRKRDELIFAQESLLNVYRCRFNVDTQVVPGDCADGEPAQDQLLPPPFQGMGTQQDLGVRDQLVITQEALLNDYRCLFKIDAQIVPGGCNRIAVVFDLAIWIMDGDGEGARKIVTADDFATPGFSSLFSNPVWSHDGTRIAFVVAYYGQPWDGLPDKSDIWTINDDGTGLEVLLDGENADIQRIYNLTWSPDGTKLAYQSICCDRLGVSTTSNLTVVDVDGSNSTLISKVSTHRAFSWSPDGSQIVYSEGLTRDNWIANADGTNQRRLNGLGADFGPIWSPDGSRIAIGVTSRPQNRKEIWVFDADGRNQRRVASSAHTFGTPLQQGEIGFTWSFDGKQITYFDIQGDNVILTLMDANGSNKYQIATLEGVASHPVWSPDGTRIAYSPGGHFVGSNETNLVAEGLWVVFADGTNQWKLASGPVYTRNLSWSP